MLLMQENNKATFNKPLIASFFSVEVFLLLSFSFLYITCALKSISRRIKITNVQNRRLSRKLNGALSSDNVRNCEVTTTCVVFYLNKTQARTFPL